MTRRTDAAQAAPLAPTDDLFDAEPAEAAADQRRDALLADLDRWVQQGWLRELDRSFALFCLQRDPEAGAELLLAAALASHQLGRGHVCLDLQATLADGRHSLSLPPDSASAAALGDGPQRWLQPLRLATWRESLATSRLCGRGDPAEGATPLVLQGPRLYLRRYWQYEQQVRARIEARLTPAPVAPADHIRPVLDRLFGSGDGTPDWQKMACALALRQRFAVVTGGPGTGKTTTVVRLLALLQSMAMQGSGAPGRPLRIQLAAPTGKAAARLTESIRGALDALPWHQLPGGADLRSHVPAEARTLHRLLGSRPDTRHLRHHAGHPLPLDVLVVDEASMVDLEMMAALLDALPPQARLVLLGDKDQLASVEAGAVLGELCSRAEAGHYDAATLAWLQAATGQTPPADLQDPRGQPLDQAIAMLRVSRRFDAGSGIGRLATAVNAGRAADALALFDADLADLRRNRLTAAPGHLAQDAGLRALLLADDGIDDAPAADAQSDGRQPVGPAHWLRRIHEERPDSDAPRADWDVWAARLLQASGRFQLLCALREGPWGVAGLNAAIADLLHAEGWIAATQGWYAGRPVLVTRNDPALGLMNGDVGLTLQLPARFDDTTGRPVPEAGTALRVAFAAADGSGGVRWTLPARLQAVETVFAMTVHKSQGSEFEHTALLLPPTASPVLTRELVYTGITRARRWFTLVAPAGRGQRVLEAAIGRRVLRASGLMARD
ncbi:exodeoxyribonuclease V subunit alpha [uncultured Pseudacidovorax sp.]|uniref:exodeoxyribonuclease V subunit alpha n=1 Tax=uncultured Pseudacidovorax sp. TaxID=679313 RepID=UPI0025CD6B35|nr:exodeoxyribonuclease V subunit alpha [uncultured Pseudacidovorax sp.]